jgi:methyl-accepting chemotaxis protein
MSAAKTDLADRLTQLSDKLHEAADDMRALNHPVHADQLGSMASHASIYAHQLRSLVKLNGVSSC